MTDKKIKFTKEQLEAVKQFDRDFPHKENEIVCSCGHVQDFHIRICHHCGKDIYKEAIEEGKKLGLI